VNRQLFATDPVSCARLMIGCELIWNQTGGLIVETEAYAEFGDEASHAFFRKGARAFIDAHREGALYVYLNYGVHWLLNFLAKSPQGNGFVLVRALEPRVGLDIMRRRRGLDSKESLCSGPGKLTEALGINGDSHGCDFFQMKSATLRPAVQPVAIEIDRRIGITRSKELDWRFLLVGSPCVSSRKKTRLRAN
jgi:DNA-3-methyladenine glycosylase